MSEHCVLSLENATILPPFFTWNRLAEITIYVVYHYSFILKYLLTRQMFNYGDGKKYTPPQLYRANTRYRPTIRWMVVIYF